MTDPTRSRVCGSFGCKLPIGHNMGRADIPENHDPHATPDRAPIYPAYLRAVQLCQFDGCDEPAVGAYYVSVRGGSQLYVCQEHGDAISQTSHWHSVRPEDWDAV